MTNIPSEKSRLLALAADWFNVGFSDRQAPEVLECILDFAALVRAMELRPDQRIVTVEQLRQWKSWFVPASGADSEIAKINRIIVGEKK